MYYVIVHKECEHYISVGFSCTAISYKKHTEMGNRLHDREETPEE